jgi:hypothetical protein
MLPEFIYGVILVLILIAVIAFIFWALVTIVEDIFETKSITSFSKDFKDTVKHSQPDWEDIKEIASTRNLTQSKIQFTMRRYYREIIAGREDELASHKDLIKSYIDKYRKDEPFEGLPNEVRIHLERLRDHVKGSEHLLDPLTSQIKDLLTVNAKENKHQKYYTMSGFFVGLAGLAFALYTYFSQPNSLVHAKEPSQIEFSDKSVNKQIKKD